MFILVGWLALICGGSIFSEFVEHDFHMSKCEVRYSPEDQALQIAVRVFLDDLELAVEQEIGVTDLRLCTDRESSSADSLLAGFLPLYLEIDVDGHTSDLLWVGKEPSDDLSAVWIYLEVPAVVPEKSITIRNDLLMDVFDDQQNIIKLIYSRSKKSFFLFHKGDVEGTLDL